MTTFAQPGTAPVTFAQPDAGWTRPAVTGVAGEITSMVTEVITTAQRTHPRSLQRVPGPSELGTPCKRRLAYTTLGWDRANDTRDQWLSTIGTAVHAWMADTFEAQNGRLGRARYLVEQRIRLPDGIFGSSDIFDTDTGDVIDWKVVGLDRIKEYRRKGPGDGYRIQAHLYGLGFMLAGYQVRNVADVFLPRGGLLNGLYVWTEPFDYRIALDAIERYQGIFQALVTLDPEAVPERWAAFPTAADHCEWCPFFLPHSADLGIGCPGHKSRPNS